MNILHISSLLIFFITILFLSPLSVSDTALINSVCTKTPYPKDCLNCMSSNSGTTLMNVRELAGVAMQCTYNISKVVQKDFVDLANKTTDPNVKGVYNQCGSQLGDFVNKLSVATDRWWNHDDKSAKDVFGGAKDDYKICMDRVSTLPPQDIPPDVKESFETVNNTYADSYNIIIQTTEITNL